MTHIITSRCLRDGSCVDVCPVECIVPGEPVDKWPWFYIDPATCIDCGACIPECPYEAIYPEEDLITKDGEVGKNGVFVAKGGEVQSMPEGTLGFSSSWRAHDKFKQVVDIPATRILEPGQPVNLTQDVGLNYDFFEVEKDEEGNVIPIGPGYTVLEVEEENQAG